MQAKFLHKTTSRSTTTSRSNVPWYKEEVEEEEDTAKLKLYLKPILGFVYP